MKIQTQPARGYMLPAQPSMQPPPAPESSVSPTPPQSGSRYRGSFKSISFPLADPTRLAAFRRIKLNDTNPEAEFDRIVQLASKFTRAPLSLLSFIDADRQYIKAAVGLTGKAAINRQTDLSESLCQYVVTSGEPLVISNAKMDPAFSRHPSVADPGVVSYLGFPTKSPDGFVLGSLCVADYQPRDWTKSEIELMEELTQLVNHELASRHHRHGAELALQASQDRLQKVLGWADCLVWEAEVNCEDKDWQWKFNIQPSGLFHRLFAERIPPQNVGLWYRFELPDQKEMDERSRRAMLGGASEYSQVFRAIKDGSMVWLKESVTIKRLENGHFWLIGVATEITHLKDLEESLALARDQALESSKLKSQFLASMSHEIRTPMNGILGMADLLMDTHLDDSQRRMGEVILNCADSLMTIINDILDFSKIEAGKLKIESAPFDLVALVEDTAALLSTRAQEKGVEFICDIDPDLPSCFLGDPSRIRQILTNLAGNAVKFTSNGEVLVRIHQRKQTSSHSHLRISVHDTGCGIPEASQHVLFSPFMQADGSHQREHGGTGLGLAISRQLAELMGGSIQFKSVFGEGSEFWLDLALPVENNPIHEHSLHREFQAGAGFILVVDDNASQRASLVRQISALNQRVLAVNGAHLALKQIESVHGTLDAIELVIIDQDMPAMSGVDLAEALHADSRFRSIERVLMSPHGSSDSERISKLGFAAVINKPPRLSQLRRLVQTHQKHSLNRADCTRNPTDAYSQERLVEIFDFQLASTPNPPLELLVVEDNPSNQIVARELLTKLGYRITLANHGQEALTLLESRSFDAIIMDCQMPVLDGYETTRRIRSGNLEGVNPTIPIIALTAYAMVGDRARCIDSGMSDYVSKPLRLKDIQGALTRTGVLSSLPR